MKVNCVAVVAQKGRLSKIPVVLSAYPGDTVYIQSTRQRCDVLFKTLCGLHKPEQGQVLIQNTDIYTLPSEEAAAFRRDRIGGIPYGGGLIPELRMIDQIALPLKLAGMENGSIVEQIRKMTNHLLPFHSLFNPPSRVTERKKAHAAIIRTLITKPCLIIMNGFLDDYDEIDADALWQIFQELCPNDSVFLYLSSNPAPEQIVWTKKLRI